MVVVAVGQVSVHQDHIQVEAVVLEVILVQEEGVVKELQLLLQMVLVELEVVVMVEITPL
jgi:hypothetical protein